jgi:phosphatidylglycerol---prolipoprotein diacylglyceryl transferase
VIPFVSIPPVSLGPLTVQPFGLLVAAAVLLALAMARRASVELNLDRRILDRLLSWVLVGGLIGAHVLSVFLYFPRLISTDPLLLLRFWEHLSSFGGMVGGLLAIALFMRLVARGISRPTKFSYLHLIAFVFPFSLAIGRAGCAVVHDHPGSLTDFPLAVSLESEAAQSYAATTFSSAELAYQSASTLAFHDLGLYELLFLIAVLSPAFVYLRRRFGLDFPYELAFVVMYMPVRFALDFLRVADVTYAGLTPAQWMALAALAAAPFYWSYTKALRSLEPAADRLPSQ